jgi:hypothetical protein
VARRARSADGPGRPDELVVLDDTEEQIREKFAYQWWVRKGRPSHDRFGISVGPTGQSVWLDEPGQPVLMP